MVKRTIAAAAALAAGLGVASAQDMGNVRLGVHVGANFITSSDASSVVGEGDDAVSVNRDFDFDGGVAVGATAGIAVTDSLMVEAEYTFRNNEFAEDAFGERPAADDDLNTSAFMVNALVPMEVDTQTTGYLGAGVGYILKHDSDRSVPVLDELDGAFAWQVKAGLDYDMGGRTLGFGLTYLSAEFGGDDIEDEAEVEIGSLMATVSLKFGG